MPEIHQQHLAHLPLCPQRPRHRIRQLQRQRPIELRIAPPQILAIAHIRTQQRRTAGKHQPPPAHPPVRPYAQHLQAIVRQCMRTGRYRVASSLLRLGRLQNRPPHGKRPRHLAQHLLPHGLVKHAAAPLLSRTVWVHGGGRRTGKQLQSRIAQRQNGIRFALHGKKTGHMPDTESCHKPHNASPVKHTPCNLPAPDRHLAATLRTANYPLSQRKDKKMIDKK